MDNECSKYPEIAEGNGIQSPGVRAKKSRDISQYNSREGEKVEARHNLG